MTVCWQLLTDVDVFSVFSLRLRVAAWFVLVTTDAHLFLDTIAM